MEWALHHVPSTLVSSLKQILEKIARHGLLILSKILPSCRVKKDSSMQWIVCVKSYGSMKSGKFLLNELICLPAAHRAKKITSFTKSTTLQKNNFHNAINVKSSA